MDINFTTAQNDIDLTQILELQTNNLRHTKSLEIEKVQGFVTVVHTLDLLREMNNEAKHIIAKDGEKVVGYALAMTKLFRNKIPALQSMFNLLDSLEIDGSLLKDSPYLVMGQICVHEQYRGLGVVKGMYEKYFEIHKPIFHRVITEIAARNTRSIGAHLNVGFKEIYRYDEPGVEEWVVVAH